MTWNPASEPEQHDRRSAPLLNVDLAFRKLTEIVRPVADYEDVGLAHAVGRVTAADIAARIDLPPFDSSAMDGYAVDATGLHGASRPQLVVIDQSTAGHPARRTLSAGNTIRVFTGAVMPAGANAVALQEDVVREGDTVTLTTPVRIGQHVRRQGSDIGQGDTMCRAGKKLSAYDLSWLAACGIATVRVARRIRVAVFSTGDELASAGDVLKAGQIYDSNRFALKSLLREKAVQVIDLGCLPDDRTSIRTALLAASAQADLVVTSGGVSVGDADFVKDVVAEIGAIEFWKIALKPGKPLAVGSIGDALFFGLPGNPVSTIVTYLLFVAPAVDLLAGDEPMPPMALPATLLAPMQHAKGRREYVRGAAKVEGGRLVVSVTGDQGSNRLATFANANCLVEISEDVANLRPGDAVSVILLAGEGAHLLRETRETQEAPAAPNPAQRRV